MKCEDYFCSVDCENIIQVLIEVTYTDYKFVLQSFHETSKPVVANLFCAAAHLEGKTWPKPCAACGSCHFQKILAAHQCAAAHGLAITALDQCFSFFKLSVYQFPFLKFRGTLDLRLYKNLRISKYATHLRVCYGKLECRDTQFGNHCIPEYRRIPKNLLQHTRVPQHTVWEPLPKTIL
jgi:hypothetical protein